MAAFGYEVVPRLVLSLTAITLAFRLILSLLFSERLLVKERSFEITVDSMILSRSARRMSSTNVPA